MSKGRNRWELDPATLHPLLVRWKPAQPMCLRCSLPPLPGTLVCEEHSPQDGGLEAYLTTQIFRLPILIEQLPICTYCRHPFLLNGIPFSVCQRCTGRFYRKGGSGFRVDTPEATE